ncbi:MAG TPA: glycosyltransferase family 2 protein [Candidatus Hydrogenedentes bacterium]|nr:glycosyltransferase family 2 protein [Candidatus Hydrogenedentota bacterium]HPG66378.1 glycosyltransferase family 2 protein [Candidatus Hydrogenedentota bacterium]
MGDPLVYVLIINWNGREHLAECFDSLLAGTYQNARFVLVDNASDDDSVAFVEEHYDDPRVDIIECGGNLGWSGGNNVGMARALEDGADYVFLLNNDTVTAPGAIARLVKMAEERPEIGALAPKMLLYRYPVLLNSVGLGCSIIGSSWDLGIGRLDGPQWSCPQPVIGVCGGACLFRAEALRKAGNLPGDFEIYLDDLDLCLRIWNAGYEIWSCPEAVVRHKFGATMEQGQRARRKYYLNTRNRFYVILRGFPLSKWPGVKLCVLVGESRAMGRALIGGEFWRAAAHVRAWAAAVAYLPKAWAERRRRRRNGMGTCRFWHLIRKDMLFFGGTEFPEDGWYAEQTLRRRRVRPISSRAQIPVEAGTLRVTLLNRYPRVGVAAVHLSLGGRHLGTLECKDGGIVEKTFAVPKGLLVFEARRMFTAEETGARMDLGGWIGMEAVNTTRSGGGNDGHGA